MSRGSVRVFEIREVQGASELAPPREVAFPSKRNSVPNLASQIRTAFSSMASNTGSRLRGEATDDLKHLRRGRLLL